MKILIVDDEKHARALLKDIVVESELAKEVFLAENLKEAVNYLKNESIDICFMDIEMPGEKGIFINDFINRDKYKFKLIYTTAYEEYAVDAFEVGANGYLLKPIRVSKVLKILSEFTQNDEVEDKKLVADSFSIPIQGGVKLLKKEDCIRLEASGSYTQIFTQTENIVVSKPLSFFIQKLGEDSRFFQPHRSHIVNTNFIDKYIKSDGGQLFLLDKTSVPVSNTKKEELLRILET